MNSDNDGFKSAIDRALDVMKKLPKDSNGGSLPCPYCGGTIRWARAGPKKHLRIQCSTEGCIWLIQ